MTILPQSVNGISEDTVVEETGIDGSRVIQDVMNTVGKQKRTGRNKILRRALIAAAVCVLAVSIVSLPIVAEKLHILYGNIFGGDKYTADFESVSNADVKISDPNLKLDSVSVSGNGSMDDLIDIRLSKKNGDKFTYNEFGFVKRGNVMVRFEGQDDPDPVHKHDLEVVIGEDKNADTANKPSGLSYTAFYGLEDDKTLQILIDISVYTHDADGKILSGSLQGRRISIKSHSYPLASIDNTLGSFESMDELSYENVTKLQNENTPALTYDIRTNSYYYTDLIYQNESFDLVSGRIKNASLPFELSFVMECGNENNSIPVSDDIASAVFGTEAKDVQISFSPVGFTLSAKTSENAAAPDMKKCYVLTNTGEKYYLIANGCIYSQRSVRMNCKFGSIPDGIGSMFDKKVYLLDPDNIKELVLNDIVVCESKND